MSAARIILIALSASAALARLDALEIRLTWTVGSAKVLFTETIERTDEGVSAVVISSAGEYDSLSMDGKRSTTEWRRRVSGEGTDITALREGGRVTVRGSFKGKPYDRAMDFGDLPWYQFQEISYEALFASGAPSRAFWTIDRKTLKPSLFKAEREGTESIAAMGRPIAAARYALTVEGVPEFLFKAHFWLRESDGRMLRLEVPPVLGLPRSVVELSGETK
jgi:hypothetical protein